jgi:hypothetical protein
MAAASSGTDFCACDVEWIFWRDAEPRSLRISGAATFSDLYKHRSQVLEALSCCAAYLDERGVRSSVALDWRNGAC